MTFDSSNTGDNWDDFVPEPPTPPPATTTISDQPPVMASQQLDPNFQGPKSSFLKGLGMRALSIPVIAGFALFGWVANRGTTIADDLKPGDCFVMPADGEEFERLDTEECGMPHDGQIVATVTVTSFAEYPAFGAPYWSQVYEECQEASVNVIRVEQLPGDTILDFFSPVEAGWDAGERESLCYLHSPSGLDGSFVGIIGS